MGELGFSSKKKVRNYSVTHKRRQLPSTQGPMLRVQKVKTKRSSNKASKMIKLEISAPQPGESAKKVARIVQNQPLRGLRQWKQPGSKNKYCCFHRPRRVRQARTYLIHQLLESKYRLVITLCLCKTQPNILKEKSFTVITTT